MSRRLCIVLSFVLAILVCGSISNVKSVSASSLDNEIIVLNDDVNNHKQESLEDYPGAVLVNPNNTVDEEEEQRKIQTSVVLIVCLVSIFGVIALIFTVGVSIGVAYFKYSKSSQLIDKTKNSLAGRIAIRIAKTSGHPVASTVATAVEKAPTWLSNTKQVQADMDEDLEQYYY